MHKKRFNRKAQLTLFMLIGIFIIGVFAFVWYLNSSMAQGQLQAPTEKIIADLLKTGAIPYYVGVCLEQEAKQGLTYIGQQGGDIFNDEEGTAPNPTRFLPLSYRVTYGISAPYLVNGTVFPYPPGYPGGVDNSRQVPYLNFNDWGRFGEVSLRKLCNTRGANSPYVFTSWGGAAGSAGAISTPICLNNIYTDTLSTQWQLEQYIQKKVFNCTNWTAIFLETGYNVTPTGDPNITFRLGMEDVWVDAFIPLELKVGGQEPVYTIGDFHTRLPIRLKRIVEFASFMATYDSYVLNFNLSNDYKIFSHWDTNIRVSVDTPFKPAAWEDVVTIEDSASILDGQNYVYRFARQNRYPALDLIHQMTNWSDYDIVVMENDTIRIDPNPLSDSTEPGKRRIYDPDEDKLTYYYTGWKETCDENFDFDLGIPRNYCSMQEPTRPSMYFKFPNVNAEVNLLKWERYPAWKYLFYLGSLGDAEYPDEAPRNWTSSPEYIATGRNATYIPDHTDIGPHNVTVWVCDEQGLCDYQIVRIMVFDYPMLQLNGTNPYPDIPYDRASVEDFYSLRTDGTTAYYTPLLGYIFTDAEEPFQYRIEHPMQILDLPTAPPDYSRDIRYIWNFTFNRTSLCNSVSCSAGEHKLHQINLSIPLLDIPPKTMNVTVYQCLPHRNNADPYPWPYNKTVDAYLASHTCCSLGGRYNATRTRLVDNALTVENGYGNNLDQIIVYDPSGNEVTRESYTPPTGDSTVLTTAYSYYTRDATPEAAIAETEITFSITKEEITIVFPPGTENIDAYTVEEVAKETVSYPKWGAVFDTETVCYGGEPMVGALPKFEVSDKAAPPDVGITTTLYGGLTEMLPEWWNDVVAMDFRRFCSGKRGNVCDGLAEQQFSIVENCDDMDTSAGEVESCQGPPTTLMTPRPMTPTGYACPEGVTCPTGKCISGRCYTTPDGASCTNYEATDEPNSFEKAYGIPRRDGTTQTGVCNPNPACSDSSTEYSSQPDGQYLLNQATCGSEGKCDKPLAGYTDCYDYNGRDSGIEPIDTTFLPADYPYYCIVNGDSLTSHNFSCSKEGAIACSPKEGAADPDEARALCEACGPGNRLFIQHSGEWADSRKLCCGDDIGEGGFPYGKAKSKPAPGRTSPRLPAATSATNPTRAGSYGTPIRSPTAPVTEGVCDDYYGGDIANQIDNDCDELPNCADSDCRMTRGTLTFTDTTRNWDNYLGPQGSLCCNTNSDCSGRITFYTDAMGCNTTKKECMCTAPTTSSPTTAIRLTEANFAGTGVVTCVPNTLMNTYYARINLGSAKKVVISSENIDRNDDTTCSDSVELFYKILVGPDENPERTALVVASSGETSSAINFMIALYNSGSNCIVKIRIV